MTFGLWNCEPIARWARNIPDMSLKERALAAYKSGNSGLYGGGRCNPWSYADGYFNAVRRCSALFGVKPFSCNFKKSDGEWYLVEIEDIVLMTRNYGEYFGMFYWLASSCPTCGEVVRGNKIIGDLQGLGKAMEYFEPHETHRCNLTMS